MSADAEKLRASMTELVKKMVEPALQEICARTEALIRLGGDRRRELELRVRQLESLAGVEPPALEPQAKSMLSGHPRWRWNQTLETWEVRQ